MIKTYPKFFFLLFVTLITAAFFGLIGGFIMALFWAIIFAILFHRQYEKILTKFPTRPNLAASLTLGLLLTVVIVPFTIVTIAVINEANAAYEKIATDEQTLQDRVEDIQEQLPIGNETLRTLGLRSSDIKKKFTEFMNRGTVLIAGNAVGLTQNMFGFMINFALMLYIFYFFVRDGKRLIQELMWVVPISDKKETALFHRFESVARATVKGSLLVALAQGSLGGLLFYILGIPSAFLWGILMTLASLLPIGSAIIWGPFCIYFFFQGNYINAFTLLIVGAGFIGLIDNFLRPFLVGRDTKMPDYLILLTTLGGLSWFGISGFVIGPIIASLFITCWQMMGTEFGRPRTQVVTEPTAEEIAEGSPSTLEGDVT